MHKMHPINFMLIVAAFLLLFGFWIILKRKKEHEMIGLVILMGGFLLPLFCIAYRCSQCNPKVDY